MITRFKLFEYTNIVAHFIPWLNSSINDILKKHNMWVDLTDFGRNGASTLLFRSHHLNNTCDAIISDINLTSLFEAINNLMEHRNNAWNRLTPEKVSEIIDEICEYQVMKVNSEYFEDLKKWMSNKLIEKLENDPDVGPRISANKYNL